LEIDKLNALVGAVDSLYVQFGCVHTYRISVVIISNNLHSFRPKLKLKNTTTCRGHAHSDVKYMDNLPCRVELSFLAVSLNLLNIFYLSGEIIAVEIDTWM